MAGGLESLTFAGAGGAGIGALLALPPESSGAPPEAGFPGLLLVHEVFGLDAHQRDLAQRFADQGFVVLAPDLYSRTGSPGPAATERDPAPEWSADRIRAAVASLPDRQALGDLEAGLAWLEAREGVDRGRLAVVGCCMGGNLAFQLGCTSRRLAAVVDFYGRLVYPELSRAKPIQPLELALNLSVPLLALFGEEDASIPAEQVERLRATLSQFMKTHRIEVLPGAGHGFLNDRRPGYHEPSARRAWALALEFLREALEPD